MLNQSLNAVGLTTLISTGQQWVAVASHNPSIVLLGSVAGAIVTFIGTQSAAAIVGEHAKDAWYRACGATVAELGATISALHHARRELNDLTEMAAAKINVLKTEHARLRDALADQSANEAQIVALRAQNASLLDRLTQSEATTEVLKRELSRIVRRANDGVATDDMLLSR